MTIRDEIHSKNVMSLKQLYEYKYANWIEIDGSKSKWFLKEELVLHLEKETMRRQNYTDLKTKGLAAPVHDIGISLIHIQTNLSKFGEYCPVSLLDNGQLEKGPSNTIYTAEFEGRFYKLATREDLQIFLESPEKYAFAPDLPETLPQRKSSAALVFPRQLELQGYCPVTLAEGPPGFESIIPGDPNLIVEYEEKLFSFTTEENLEKFMKTPWDYVNLELPKKLPPKLVNINIGQLPLIGYLTQSVARELTDALTEVGKVRPKHPYKSLTKSAADYLALYLKAHNPKNKEWVQKQYTKDLRKFIDRCTLITDISGMVRANSPESALPFGFIPVHDRQIGLDEKIHQFFTLQTQ
ncbi:UNVERIFIED_CONTAM: adenylate kinase [Siphonaria sp. JEL0065]|nr:adenylate kinase [Siphonaria sp. JEL0065]